LTFKLRQLHKLEQEQKAKSERDLKLKQQQQAKWTAPKKRARKDDYRDDSADKPHYRLNLDRAGELSGSSDSGSSQSYSDDYSDEEDSYSSDGSDESYGRRRRRDQKAVDKRGRRHGKNEILRVHSSDDDMSDDSHRRDDRKLQRRGHDPRSTISRELKPQGEQAQDIASRVKDVELKEFQKICVRRRDLCKWIEHPDF